MQGAYRFTCFVDQVLLGTRQLPGNRTIEIKSVHDEVKEIGDNRVLQWNLQGVKNIRNQRRCHKKESHLFRNHGTYMHPYSLTYLLKALRMSGTR